MRNTFLLKSAALALVPAFAMAQTSTGGSGSADADGSRLNTLGEVIVTAQRQSESAQHAAVPLSVIEGSALLEQGITQVDGLNKMAPALSIAPTNTGNVIFVRGVGNFTLAPNSDPAVSFNYDGVYVGRPTSTTGVFYDLERIEILKGPQGILYGRNATGGALNVLPAQPKYGALSGHAAITVGNYTTFNAEAALNLPVGESSAFRLSASRSSHNGYLSDGTSDEDTTAARLQFKTELGSNATLRIAGDYAHNGGFGNGIDYQGVFAGVTNFTPSGIPLGTGVNAPASQAFRQNTTFAPLGNRLPALATPFQGNFFAGINAELEYRAGAGTLTVIPAWRHAKLNFMAGAGGIPYYDDEDDKQTSLEVRFAGTRIGPVDYQVGAYYYDEQLAPDTQLSTGNTGNFQQPRYGTKSAAAFGRLTFHVSDRARLVGGLRYTKDEKTFSTVQVTSIISCVVVIAGRPTCPNAPTVPLFTSASQLGYVFPAAGGGALPILVNGVSTGALSIRNDVVYNNLRLNNNKLTYRGAFEFDVGPSSLLYASYETGYRSGGFSVAVGYETYQPETVNAITVGMKNRFLDDRLQLNGEAYVWDYKNQQVTHIGLDQANRTANFTQNIGSSKIKGLEVDAQLLVTPNTLVTTDVQYLDAKQQDFNYLAGSGAAPVVGCAVTPVTGTTTPWPVNCSGLPSYNSPKLTINLGAQHTFRLERYEVVLSADAQRRSSRYIGFAYLSRQLIDASTTSNAQLQFRPNAGRWTLAAYVRNMEDERIPIYSIVGSSNFLATATTAPRTYGLRLAVQY